VVRPPASRSATRSWTCWPTRRVASARTGDQATHRDGRGPRRARL